MMNTVFQRVINGRQPRWMRWLLALGALTLLTRIVLDSVFRNGTVLYVGVPYVLAIVLYYWLSPPAQEHRIKSLGRYTLTATIFMLAISAFLFEGFLCVLMFMPIFYFVIFCVFLYGQIFGSKKERQADVFKVSLMPLIVIILCLEGVSQTLSFPREEHVTSTRIVEGSIDDLKANMARPIVFDQKRGAFLSLFPLPDKVVAQSLKVGDVHKMHFTYKKWMFTNFVHGEMWLEIADIGPQSVETKIIRNDSYLSHYMEIEGTSVRFTPIDEGRTEVSITIHYQRTLDPVWYFGPLERMATRQSADYLIRSVIAQKSVIAPS